ncbi:MAG TPA: helix-turn-helix domain-containing protein [Nevskia sp.]|jgi:DNA-binding HxlR family transcriptional regulator|nr:helix-turn-helix domain-containing protein [Nevskia sp.]
MRWDEIEHLPCSIARSLSVVGDRWTLLVLRESFLGVRRFEDFQAHLGMARHRLTDRLNRLVEHEVLKRVPYQDKPLRYEYRLTEKGLELYPVMLSLVRWGDRWMDQGKGPPVIYRHKPCGRMTLPGQNCSSCGQELKAREVTPMAGPGLRDPKQKARLRA